MTTSQASDKTREARGSHSDEIRALRQLLGDAYEVVDGATGTITELEDLLWGDLQGAHQIIERLQRECIPMEWRPDRAGRT